MAGSEAEHSEWIDGFLFIGNHLALNFLNTKPVLDGAPLEFLPDAKAFGRWLVAAGLATPTRVKSAMQKWRESSTADRFVKELRRFREEARAAVLRIEAGSVPAESFVAEVNHLLAKHPRRSILVREGRSLVRKFPFEADRPEDFWALIAEAFASLLAETDHSRMRKCESCVVHFLDTSKKGSRRWCSMNICGNKVKVASYQRRKRSRTGTSKGLA
jgi:predicted RNA-binding Zn ribbon-like protein